MLERLGPCNRGENGGFCPLLHPKDCTEPACHANGGREATKCDGWHLFKKYSELKAKRKERAKASKERRKAERKFASGRPGVSKTSAKGNDYPGKKAASLGPKQRAKKQQPKTAAKAQNRQSFKPAAKGSAAPGAQSAAAIPSRTPQRPALLGTGVFQMM